MGNFFGTGVPWLILLVAAVGVVCALVVRRPSASASGDGRQVPRRTRPHADLVRQAQAEASAGGLVGDLARAYVQRRVQQLSEAQARPPQ